LGLNEADTFKSISTFIYLVSKQSIYTQRKGLMPLLIKIGSYSKGFTDYFYLGILIETPQHLKIQK